MNAQANTEALAEYLTAVILGMVLRAKEGESKNHLTATATMADQTLNNFVTKS